MQPVLEIRNLSKSFSRGNERLEVLEDLSLDVYKGEILCLLGPSGCGKSTLLRQIAGLDMHDGGSILMHGEEITRPQVSRMLIFQDFNQLFPWKTVMQNVVYALKVNGIGRSSSERNELASRYLSIVKLNGFCDSYPCQLSGGMKQKAAIARALALSPEVLLMDEPFGSLDALTRASLQTTMLEVWESTGVTIVLVTHDIQEAVIVSDRIMVMSKQKGKIKSIIKNSLKRPRAVGDPGFPELFREVYGLIEL